MQLTRETERIVASLSSLFFNKHEELIERISFSSSSFELMREFEVMYKTFNGRVFWDFWKSYDLCSRACRGWDESRIPAQQKRGIKFSSQRSFSRALDGCCTLPSMS